jgi:hypothetical protein
MRLPCGLALAAMVLLAGTARALEADLAWDQGTVTEYARQLSSSVDVLYKEAKIEQNEASITSVTVDTYVFVNDLQALRRHTARLEKALTDGNGQEETATLFARIQRLVRDVRDSKRFAHVLEGDAAVAEIERARGYLTELTRFYEKSSTPPVASPPAQE